MIKNIMIIAMAMIVSAGIASAQTAPVAGSTPYYMSIMGGTEVSPGAGFDRQSVGKFSVGSYVNSISKDLRGEFSYERLIGNSHGILGEKSGNMFLATALYDFSITEKYTGLIFSAGPTVGYLALDGSRAVNGAKEDGFVYGGILETSFRLTPNVALVGSYQYITSTEAETIKRDGTSTAWTNQSVLAGLRYRF